MSLVVHSLCPHGLNSFDLCRHTVRSYIDAALNDDLRGFWTMNLSPQTLSPSPYSLATKESDALSSLVAAGKKALNILLITPTTVFTELQSLPHSVLPLFCSENSEVNYLMLKEFSDKCDAEKPLWMLVLFFFLSKKVDDILASLIKQNQGKNPTVASTISKIGRHYTKSHTFFFHARTILGNRTYMTELLLLICMTPSSNAEYLAQATAHLHKFEYKDSASNYIRMIQLAHALDLLKNQKSFNRIFELSRTNTFLQHFNRVPIPEKLAVFIEMQGIAKGQSNLDVLMKAFNGPKIYDAITSLATSSIVFDHTGVKTTDDAQNDDHMKDEEGEDLLFVIDQAGDSQGLDDDEEVDVKQENEVSKNIALLLGSMEDSVKDNVIENEELVETQDADAGAPEEPIEIDTGSAKLLTSDAPASSQEEIIDSQDLASSQADDASESSTGKKTGPKTRGEASKTPSKAKLNPDGSPKVRTRRSNRLGLTPAKPADDSANTAPKSTTASRKREAPQSLPPTDAETSDASVDIAKTAKGRAKRAK